MVICFHTANATTTPFLSTLSHVFQNKKPMTVEKNMARSIWNTLMARDGHQDGGWKSSNIVGNPPSATVQMAEQAVNP
jgi:hypothetical protein